VKNALAGFAMATMLFGMAGFAYSSTRSPARTSAVTPAQFRVLRTRVAKLEKTTGALATYTVGCLFKWTGVARFGVPPSSGYVYDTDNNPANGQFLASALDMTDVGETPQAYFVTTQDTNCLPSGLALKRSLRSFQRRAVVSKGLGGAIARAAATPYGPHR
jgi:hypothetical protein